MLKRTLSSIFNSEDKSSSEDAKKSKRSFPVAKMDETQLKKVFTDQAMPEIRETVAALNWLFDPSHRSSNIVRPSLDVAGREADKKRYVVVTFTSMATIVVDCVVLKKVMEGVISENVKQHWETEGKSQKLVFTVEIK